MLNSYFCCFLEYLWKILWKIFWILSKKVAECILIARSERGRPVFFSLWGSIFKKEFFSKIQRKILSIETKMVLIYNKNTVMKFKNRRAGCIAKADIFIITYFYEFFCRSTVWIRIFHRIFSLCVGFMADIRRFSSFRRGGRELPPFLRVRICPRNGEGGKTFGAALCLRGRSFWYPASRALRSLTNRRKCYILIKVRGGENP